MWALKFDLKLMIDLGGGNDFARGMSEALNKWKIDMPAIFQQDY